MTQKLFVPGSIIWFLKMGNGMMFGGMGIRKRVFSSAALLAESTREKLPQLGHEYICMHNRDYVEIGQP